MGLLDADETPPIQPLTGGVSSDIVRADLQGGPVCIKRALPKLKVKADWQAPVERNRWEVEWMRTAGAIVPDAVPRILGEDRAARHVRHGIPGRARAPGVEGAAARRHASIRRSPRWSATRRSHPRRARRATRRSRSASPPTTSSFPIRLEPYLIATARAHPDCAARLEELARVTAATKLALVHGDVSPKNILCGPRGPVFLDAECAWYGDPAFDLAFCLNHMLLKCLWRPQWSARYLACFDALAAPIWPA